MSLQLRQRAMSWVAMFLVLLVGASEAAPNVDESRIVNGTEVPEGKYPFMVSVTLVGQHHCGGSIVNKDWVLTAAHCMQDVMSFLKYMRIHTGITKLNGEGNLYDIESAVVHEKFDEIGFLENDIALLKVHPSFLLDDNEAAVKLPTQGLPVTKGTPVTVIGWGYEKSNGTGQNSLMEVDLEVAGDPECEVAPFNDQKLCSHFPGDGKGDCQGDSGGPVFLKDGTQVGIVSYGGVCGVGYNVYAEVPNYVDWINEKIASK